MSPYECDCGRAYSHPDAVLACAQGGHGQGCQGCLERDARIKEDTWQFDILLKTLYRQKRRQIYTTLARMIAERFGVTCSTKTGRCANGAERDGGAVAHIIPKGTGRAICGTEPGRHSGWSSHEEPAPTCEKCLEILPGENPDD